MIKGIVALFTSGAIFNPMILLGIGFGILFEVKMTYEQMMEQVYKNYHFYLLALLLAAAYNFVFHKIYCGEDCDRLDKGAMAGNVIFSALKFVISSVLTIAFIEVLVF